MTSHPASQAGQEVIRWKAYPAWSHFLWLYFFSALTGFRALPLIWSGVEGWEVWLGGALALLGCAAALRHWAFYYMTSTRLGIINGYTGREIASLAIAEIGEVVVRQGLLARWLDIGTLVITSAKQESYLSFKGIHRPEVIKTRLLALSR
ncbi:MAG: PH domain-containing protein [Nitrospirae bacterium]|nr:MAG: PH domain-containing protein [Nitrospirota bacterium]